MTHDFERLKLIFESKTRSMVSQEVLIIPLHLKSQIVTIILL